MMVDIKGLDRANVAIVLYEHAKRNTDLRTPAGLIGIFGEKPDVEYLRAGIEDGHTYIDYLAGRCLKVDLSSEDFFDSKLYNMNNGEEAAEKAIESYRRGHYEGQSEWYRGCEVIGYDTVKKKDVKEYFIATRIPLPHFDIFPDGVSVELCANSPLRYKDKFVAHGNIFICQTSSGMDGDRKQKLFSVQAASMNSAWEAEMACQYTLERFWNGFKRSILLQLTKSELFFFLSAEYPAVYEKGVLGSEVVSDSKGEE